VKLIAANKLPVTGLNGAFELYFPMGVTLVFAGAPFRMANNPTLTHLGRPGTQPYRVKCATEVAGVFDFEVPCEDFGVPKHWDMKDAVYAAIEAAFQGRPVFAGCMGGIGRTGTFLAVVLKVLCPEYGYETDGYVMAVRQLYLRNAVETQAQANLVSSIDVYDLRSKIKWLWLKAVIRNAFTKVFG
jgi:hypothetical protein